jgi:hypothetical protein
MPKIFVSYSHLDKEIAVELVGLLRRKYGHDEVWYDDQLRQMAGRPWWETICRAIAESEVFLYLLSNESVESVYCRAQFTEATRLGRPYVFVQVRGRTQLPEDLQRYQYLDFSQAWKQDPHLQIDLYNSIEQQAAEPRPRRANWQPVTPYPGQEWMKTIPPDQTLTLRVPITPAESFASTSTQFMQRAASSFLWWCCSVTLLLLLLMMLTGRAFWLILTKDEAVIGRNTPSALQTEWGFVQTDEAAATFASTTAARQTYTPTPLPEVALRIVNTSGQEIGEGTFRLYTSDFEATYGETIRVELEVYFDNYYITPTPFGNVTKIPARTATPDTGQASPTSPPVTPTATPFYISEDEQIFYQRMGASLACSETSFRGCGQKRDEIIGLDGHRWIWTLSPHENASGIQDLLAEVWILQSVDGRPEQAAVVWDHAFQVNVLQATESQEGFLSRNMEPLIGLVGAILVAFIGLWGVYISRGEKIPKPISTPPTAQSSPKKVFLSYRRKDTSGWTTSIHQSIVPYFAEVFHDVHSIRYGSNFEAKINEAVWSCDVLVAVIGKKWLTEKAKDPADGIVKPRLLHEKDYVRLEIAAAMKRGIRVIPALVDDAKMPSEDKLPDELKPLTKYNAVQLRNDSFADDIQRLIRSLQ